MPYQRHRIGNMRPADHGDRDWMLRADCRGSDPETWHPPRGNSKGSMNALRAICAACPVQPDCLEYALAKHEPMGFWGGYTERERRKLRRERRLAAAEALAVAS